MARPKGVSAKFSSAAEEIASKVVIESDIPIPTGNKYGHWLLIAAKMNVGNSILLKDDDSGKAVQKAIGFKMAMRKSGKDCVTRSMDGGVRVWCTKAPKKTSNSNPAAPPAAPAASEAPPPDGSPLVGEPLAAGG